MRCRRSVVRVATLEECVHYGQQGGLPKGLRAPIAGAASYYAATVLDDGPVGYWRCGDSGSPLIDQEGANNLTATSVTGGTYQASGALVNDPDGAVTLASAGCFLNSTPTSSLKITGSLTLECWVDPANVTQTSYLVMSDATGNAYYYLYIANQAIAFGWIHVGVNWFTVTSGNVLVAGAWQHLVGTWDGTHNTLYYNGAQTAQTTPGNTISGSMTAFSVGADYSDGATSNTLNGTIDEVAVYGKALSASQVATHYAVGRGARFSQAGARSAVMRAPR